MQPDEITTTTGLVFRAPDIVPAPNSGRAPVYATDPGGWAQYALLAGIVAAIAIVVLLVWLESRRKRAAQAGAASTRSEPAADTSTNPSASERQ
jgi:hypothetical protein